MFKNCLYLLPMTKKKSIYHITNPSCHFMWKFIISCFAFSLQKGSNQRNPFAPWQGDPLYVGASFTSGPIFNAVLITPITIMKR